MERLIKEGHLIRYIKEVDREEESSPTVDRTTTDVAAPSESKLAINYILGGPLDDQYQSKCQHKKLLIVATVKARVNVVHKRGSQEETKLIDNPHILSPSKLKQGHLCPIMMHLYSPFVLTVLMCIGC